MLWGMSIALTRSCLLELTFTATCVMRSLQLKCVQWTSGYLPISLRAVRPLHPKTRPLKLIYLPQRNSPYWAKASTLSRLRDHTQTHHTRLDSSWRVISPIKFNFLPPKAQQPIFGQCLHIVEASRSHSDTPGPVGLLLASDQPHKN